MQRTLSKLLGLALCLVPGAVLAGVSVFLTAPTGGLYLAPATIALKANASAQGTSVERVEFYANGALLGTDTASPYEIDWTPAAGTYAISAKAFGADGSQATTSQGPTVTLSNTNTAPSVSLTGPIHNARYLSSLPVAFSASASSQEINDPVARVEFYAGGTLLGIVTTAPYNFSWATPVLGTHSVTAVAVDGQGAQTTSAPRTIIVSDQNLPPTISITSPADNSRWHSPAAVAVQASANAVEANDIVRVELYLNGTLQGQDTTSPFGFSLTLGVGTHTLLAKAIDSQNAATDSASRTLTVSDINEPPTVSITNPANGANFPSLPQGLYINAAASGPEVNGSVSKVEFYVNGTLVGTDTAAPYFHYLPTLGNGTHTLSAKAYDQLNASTTSSPVLITVGSAQAKLHFIHADHLNKPRLVADATGTTVWRWDQQEPFGNNPPDENPSGLGAFDLPLRLPGQYFDKETNLHYNMFRDYDPSLGIYKQSDPIGLLAGVNTYAYVLGNPMTYVDPSGLDVKVCHFPGAPTHIAYGVGSLADDIQTSGFYPARKRTPYGKGVIRQDDLNESGTQCKVISTTQEEDDCLTRCQKRYERDPGRYDWYRRNCSTYVRTCFQECGLSAGKDSFWPKTVYDSLPAGTPVPATGKPVFYP